MKINNNGIASKVQEVVDDLNGEIDELREENNEMKELLYKLYKDEIDVTSNSFFRKVEELVPEKFDKNIIEELDNFIWESE